MNSKYFAVLFATLAALIGVSYATLGLGAGAGLTTVALNGALTIPLLSGTAGTIAGPLAVLGVIKLGAALLYGLGYLAVDGYGYGHHDYHDYGHYDDYGDYDYGKGKGGGHGKGGHHKRFLKRHKRQATPAPDQDALFSLISAMDSYGCGKQLVCELEAKNPADLADDEALMLRLFSNRKVKKPVNAASAKAEYELAAELGMVSKNQELCRNRYINCPYTAEDMMAALRSSKL